MAIELDAVKAVKDKEQALLEVPEEELKKAINEAMQKPQSKLYKIIKEAVMAVGRWRTKPRGKSFKKGEDERRNPNPIPKK